MSEILQDIYRSALKLIEPLSEEQVLPIIVEEARKLVGADYGSVFLLKKGELRRVYTSVPDSSQLEPRKNGLTYKSFIEGKPIIISRREGIKGHPEMVKTPIQLIVIIPLTFHQHSLGVLTLQSEKMQRFSQKKLDIIQLFGSLASMSIRNIQLYNETQRALQSRDLFISMASHELKTPLSTISGYIHFLHTKIKTSKATKQQWISTIKSETLRLTHLVNELLSLDKIDSRKLEYSWEVFPLSETVKGAIGDVQFVYPLHMFIYEESEADSHEDFSVVGDKEKLLQVFINTLSNAAKFSPSQKPIHVALKKTGSEVVVSIKDQGVGIAQKDLPKIFDKFYKTSNPLYEGVGLGLYLTKQIVDKHHGSIVVRSRKKHGTTIEIRLPTTAVE